MKTLPPIIAHTFVRKCRNDGLSSVNFTCNSDHHIVSLTFEQDKKKKNVSSYIFAVDLGTRKSITVMLVFQPQPEAQVQNAGQSKK